MSELKYNINQWLVLKIVCIHKKIIQLIDSVAFMGMLVAFSCTLKSKLHSRTYLYKTSLPEVPH